ncbi:hypothetical protein [Crocosphaera chwakensis]|uniref:Uncharacterized protein n=1 Tax=Crocosphaera chwakensis CCY0110 TaxID=391612 RepID=A3IN49_9CHRO|nr:hypothetical protein [Crocosphaera chwakensis]EAZ92026.1 hypothetical protein CY0110_00170 [Crocosphaera chwakensis CCY0110]
MVSVKISIQLTSLETEAQQALIEQRYQEAISLYLQCLETEQVYQQAIALIGDGCIY